MEVTLSPRNISTLITPEEFYQIIKPALETKNPGIWLAEKGMVSQLKYGGQDISTYMTPDARRNKQGISRVQALAMAIGGNNFTPKPDPGEAEAIENETKRTNLRLVVSCVNQLLISHCSDRDVAKFIIIKKQADGEPTTEQEALAVAKDNRIKAAEILKDAPVHRYLDHMENIGDPELENTTPQTQLAPLVDLVIKKLGAPAAEPPLPNVDSLTLESLALTKEEKQACLELIYTEDLETNIRYYKPNYYLTPIQKRILLEKITKTRQRIISSHPQLFEVKHIESDEHSSDITLIKGHSTAEVAQLIFSKNSFGEVQAVGQEVTAEDFAYFLDSAFKFEEKEFDTARARFKQLVGDDPQLTRLVAASSNIWSYPLANAVLLFGNPQQQDTAIKALKWHYQIPEEIASPGLGEIKELNIDIDSEELLGHLTDNNPRTRARADMKLQSYIFALSESGDYLPLQPEEQQEVITILTGILNATAVKGKETLTEGAKQLVIINLWRAFCAETHGIGFKELLHQSSQFALALNNIHTMSTHDLLARYRLNLEAIGLVREMKDRLKKLLDYSWVNNQELADYAGLPHPLKVPTTTQAVSALISPDDRVALEMEERLQYLVEVLFINPTAGSVVLDKKEATAVTTLANLFRLQTDTYSPVQQQYIEQCRRRLTMSLTDCQETNQDYYRTLFQKYPQLAYGFSYLLKRNPAEEYSDSNDIREAAEHIQRNLKTFLSRSGLSEAYLESFTQPPEPHTPSNRQRVRQILDGLAGRAGTELLKRSSLAARPTDSVVPVEDFLLPSISPETMLDLLTDSEYPGTQNRARENLYYQLCGLLGFSNVEPLTSEQREAVCRNIKHILTTAPSEDMPEEKRVSIETAKYYLLTQLFNAVLTTTLARQPELIVAALLKNPLLAESLYDFHQQTNLEYVKSNWSSLKAAGEVFKSITAFNTIMHLLDMQVGLTTNDLEAIANSKTPQRRPKLEGALKSLSHLLWGDESPPPPPPPQVE